MRAWVAYRTFRTPDRDVHFYAVRNVLDADLLGSDCKFNLVLRSTLLALEAFIRPCMGNLRPASQIRPAKASHPARQ